MKYRLIVLALRVAVWAARKTYCPKENLRDAMGDAGMYRVLGPRNPQNHW